MFALFQRKQTFEREAQQAYEVLLDRVNIPEFYTGYGVPDTLDGRFDLLVLHMFLLINRILQEGETDEGRKFNQMLFDVMFANMDQTLRQRGIGDMGIPKHMRRMMKGFNGRMHGYETAIAEDDLLKSAIHRNVYNDASGVDDQVMSLILYVRRVQAALSSQKVGDIMNGQVELPSA